MKLLALFIVPILFIGCSDSHHVTYLPQESCTVSRVDSGALISCPDTDPVLVSDGSDGIDGADGSDGILSIIDPCGDDPGEVDEILLVLSDNTVVAWYKNVGLSILQSDVAYVTTDKQKCEFMISSADGFVEL